MKKFLFLIALLASLVTVQAQPSSALYCNITDTIEAPLSGTPLVGVKFRVIQVIKDGVSIGTAQGSDIAITTAGGALSMYIRRGSTACIYAPVPGWNRNPSGGSCVSIPDTTSAVLSALSPIVSVPSSIAMPSLGASNNNKYLRIVNGAITAATISGGGVGDLVSTNNLSDLANASTARTNLGLIIGTDVQAQNSNLTTFAGITPSANVQSLLNAPDYATMRSLQGLVIGTDVQAHSSNLTSYAGITPSADIQSLLGSANYAAMRSSLGLVIGTNVQAYDSDLGVVAALTPDNDDLLQRKAGAWANRTIAQVKTDFGLAAVATSGSAADLSTGTLPLGRLSGITTSELSGTAGITNAQLAGSIAISKLSITGTPNGSKYLRDDGSWQTVSGGAGDALVANPLSQFASTTSAQLAGVISNETGTGLAVFNDTPTLVTPVLGAATATNINKVAITAPATSATLTIADGATLTASATATVSGTNTGDQTNISGNAATVTTNANLTGVVTSTGNATAIANGAISNAMLANSAVANLSGTNTGDQTTVSGNAGTATALQTARTIGGASFDGTSNITLDAIDNGLSANGVIVRTGANTRSARTVTGTANQITVSNGDGVSGNPTLSIPNNAQLSIANITNLTANGFVKTSAADGTLSVDTASYTPTATTVAGNALSGNISQDQITGLSSTGLIKRTGANTLAVAAAGTDYLAGNQTITLSGDLSGSGATSISSTIGSNVVSNSKLSTVATGTIKGRSTAGAGNVEDLTGTQATSLLDTVTSGAKGLAPASGGGTTNFLRADGTWAAPSVGGVAWGAISGTLSDQTDLQTALDAKQATISAGNLIDLAGATVDVDLSEAATTTPVMDDTIALTDTSASNANAKATIESLMLEIRKNRHRYGFDFFTDFLQETSTTATDNALAETNSGTAAATATQASSASNRPGMARSTTGTTATGRAAVASALGAVRLGGGEWFLEVAVNVTTLSTVTERFQLVVGFLDTATAANQVDCACFIYDEGGVSTGSTASANWQAATVSNSTRTWNSGASGSSTVTAAQWDKLKIIVNAAGTQADFYVNDVLRYSHTTNIPTAAGRELGFGWLLIKSIGTTARTVDFDYVNVQAEYTTIK